MARRVLVVDGDPGVQELVRACLSDQDRVATASDPESGLEALRRAACDVLACEVRLPGGWGDALVRRALADHPDVAVVVLAPRSDLQELETRLQQGVADVLPKPFTALDLRLSLVRATALHRARREAALLREAQEAAGSFPRVLPPEGVDLRALLLEVERDFIRQALDRTGHVRQRAASLLRLERTTLVQKLRRWGVPDAPRGQQSEDS